MNKWQQVISNWEDRVSTYEQDIQEIERQMERISLKKQRQEWLEKQIIEINEERKKHKETYETMKHSIFLDISADERR